MSFSAFLDDLRANSAFLMSENIYIVRFAEYDGAKIETKDPPMYIRTVHEASGADHDDAAAGHAIITYEDVPFLFHICF